MYPNAFSQSRPYVAHTYGQTVPNDQYFDQFHAHPNNHDSHQNSYVGLPVNHNGCPVGYNAHNAHSTSYNGHPDTYDGQLNNEGGHQLDMLCSVWHNPNFHVAIAASPISQPQHADRFRHDNYMKSFNNDVASPIAHNHDDTIHSYQSGTSEYLAPDANHHVPRHASTHQHLNAPIHQHPSAPIQPQVGRMHEVGVSLASYRSPQYAARTSQLGEPIHLQPQGTHDARLGPANMAPFSSFVSPLACEQSKIAQAERAPVAFPDLVSPIAHEQSKRVQAEGAPAASPNIHLTTLANVAAKELEKRVLRSPILVAKSKHEHRIVADQVRCRNQERVDFQGQGYSNVKLLAKPGGACSKY